MMYDKVDYESLNSRQKENYNFQKVSAVLADYGFNTLRLNDDWQGADFIAQHIDGERFIKVQLKGRMTFDKKYIGKHIYIAFRESGQWYLYPHDELLEQLLSTTNIVNTSSWTDSGQYHFNYLKQEFKIVLKAYAL